MNNPLAGTDPSGYLSCSVEQTVGECGLEAGGTADIVDSDGNSLGTATLSEDGETLTTSGNNGVNATITGKVSNGVVLTLELQNKSDIGSQSHAAKGSAELPLGEGGSSENQTPQTPIDNTSPFELGVDFIMGNGETNRYFGPGSEISKEFSEGDGAKTFEDFLFNKYDGNPQPGDEVTNFGYKFTWFWRAWTTNSAEHFMGSWKGTAKVMDDMILFRAENTAGVHSLYFGRQIDEFNRQRGPDQFKLPSVPDIKTFNGKRIPFSNMNTIIEWTRELRQQKGDNQ